MHFAFHFPGWCHQWQRVPTNAPPSDMHATSRDSLFSCLTAALCGPANVSWGSPILEAPFLGGCRAVELRSTPHSALVDVGRRVGSASPSPCCSPVPRLAKQNPHPFCQIIIIIIPQKEVMAPTCHVSCAEEKSHSEEMLRGTHG